MRSQIAPRRRDPERIRAEIEASRAEIAEAFSSLRGRVGERLDWRLQVRRQPWVAMGLAYAFGYLIGKQRGRKERDG